MLRSLLLGAAALAGPAGALAAPAITGGGGSSPEFDYFLELAAFNASQTAAAPVFNNANVSAYAPATSQEGVYWGANSQVGQDGFLWNNLTCVANKVLKRNSISPYCTAPANTPAGTVLETIWNSSDTPLTAAQYAGWTQGTSYTDYAGVAVTVAAQQPIAGNLIEVPAMGVGSAIITVNSGVTANGQVSLEDSDLCGIFSGKITNWSTIAAEKYNKGKNIASGTIQVVYRSDAAATTFILTEHLSKVCNSSNANVTFVPTQLLASLFATVPANFVGESGNVALADFVSGYSGGSYGGSEISYISPDYTTIDPNSGATLTNTSGATVKSALVVAGIYNLTTKKFVLPDVTDIATALTHVTVADTSLGSTGVPATVAQAEANNAFVQVPQVVSAGYPIVGYSTLDFAQCYANPAIGTALLAFLNDHYKTASYLAIQKNNGLVSIANSGAAKYLTAITKFIFPQAGKTAVDYGTEIGSKSACKGLAGR